MTKKKYTLLDINELDVLTNDPSWTYGDYPIDLSPEPDILIGLEDAPEVLPPPTIIPEPVSLEPIIKEISPFPENGKQSRPSSQSYPKYRDLDGVPKTVDIESMLPDYIRKGASGKSLIESILYNTVDQWITPPDVENIGGYVGEVIGDDNYLLTDSLFEQKNQLQPTIRSYDGKSTDLNMTWLELLDKMRERGLDVDGKADKFFATKKFSYQPPINPDKLVNYRYFYWVKNLGSWDVTWDENSKYQLILINGTIDITIIPDLLVGDYIRLDGQEFMITGFSATTITVYEVTETVFLESWQDKTDVLMGHDRPTYNVQQESEYSSNGFVANNFWKHIDDLSLAEIDGISDKTLLKAQLPIIELLKDVIIDNSEVYVKGAVPKALMYPIQYVDFNQTSIPVNIGIKLVGYDLSGDPIYENKEGIIPVVSRPVLEYLVGPTHLDGTPTTADEILGLNVVKESADSNYIFKNGLIDDTFTDIRKNRWFVYLTQTNVSDAEEEFSFEQTVLSDTWVIVHPLGHIPLVRVFLSNNLEILPWRVYVDDITNTVTILFNTPMVGRVRLV